jgi:hypothetical protein
MDIKEKVEEIIAKFKGDPSLMKKFQEDPQEAVKSVAGVDVPDDVISKVIAALKGMDVSKGIGGVMDSVKKLF